MSREDLEIQTELAIDSVMRQWREFRTTINRRRQYEAISRLVVELREATEPAERLTPLAKEDAT